MRNPVVALEGICGSGKTTICKEISSKGFQIVRELPTYYDKTQFPGFAVETAGAIEANRWFLGREVERCRDARIMSVRGGVVADRWYYSICGVSYARSKTYGTQDGSTLQSDIQTWTSMNLLFEPTLVVIDTNVDLALKRLQERREVTEGDFNMNPDFMKWQYEYYLNLAQRERALLIDGKMSSGEAAKKIMTHTLSNCRL